MKFRTSVDAWVAQPLRGSLSPGGSRPLQTYTAELTCVGRSAQVGRSASAWVAFLLQEAFGGLPGVQIGRVIARWKAIGVYFPTQVELGNLDFIYPVKNQISQH